MLASNPNFNFAKELEEAPGWIRDVVQSHESLPWRRRSFERKGVLDQLLVIAGFPTHWKEGDEEKRVTSEEAAGAAIPQETPPPPVLELGRVVRRTGTWGGE